MKSIFTGIDKPEVLRMLGEQLEADWNFVRDLVQEKRNCEARPEICTYCERKTEKEIYHPALYDRTMCWAWAKGSTKMRIQLLIECLEKGGEVPYGP